jgi:hypothetical protein
MGRALIERDAVRGIDIGYDTGECDLTARQGTSNGSGTVRLWGNYAAEVAFQWTGWYGIDADGTPVQAYARVSLSRWPTVEFGQLARRWCGNVSGPRARSTLTGVLEAYAVAWLEKGLGPTWEEEVVDSEDSMDLESGKPS